MNNYSQEFKASIVKKMMLPNSKSVPNLSKEVGISESALYKWKNEYLKKGIAVPNSNKNAEHWSAEEKLAVIVETMPLNASQLSEYCRTKGLYPEQVKNWKIAALLGYSRQSDIEKEQSSSRKQDQTKIKKLEAELRRKDKALAETAALLVLSKKYEAIWGTDEEDL